ncbi:hypothetical protein QBC32DRAFT_112977 [Pseudoneurospora amorphoporcata]|uniref:Uncharacterized protein n=1 Tax=Pseudoneurospora amorphoporcata TaxID=241081 RepID=A0AAN6SHQ9_9PEZI|nr:hypothetical protein QBC32DRAFT_112977 [Pseudoneurospora amorphoporcata]
MGLTANCPLSLTSTSHSSSLFALIVWSFLLQHAWAQLSDAPPAAKFLCRGHCRVAVLGNYVYIDGGEISQLANPGGGPMNSTLSIDISKSWSAQTVEINVIPNILTIVLRSMVTPCGGFHFTASCQGPPKHSHFVSWPGGLSTRIATGKTWREVTTQAEVIFFC